MTWTAPRTWVAGEVVTAALLNTHLRDNLLEVGPSNTGAAWVAFTPTWTSTGAAPSLGNGTLVGRYKSVGKTTHFRLRLDVGSTTTLGTGNYLFGGLPVTAFDANALVGLSGVVGGGGGIYPVTTVISSANAFFAYGPTGVAVTGTTPTTLPTGSYIQFAGAYET